MKAKTERLTLEVLVEIRDLLRAYLPPPSGREAPPPASPEVIWADEKHLMTVKEAMHHLNASRNTVDTLRREGKLTTYKRGKSVRLLRAEVEAARSWWSIPKGKI